MSASSWSINARTSAWSGPGPNTAREAGLDQRAQMRGGGSARRDDFFRILVAQLVQRERAAGDDIERGIGEFARIERGQPRARAQVPFAVRKQRMTALGERRVEADRGERVLQRPSRPRVHVHVASGDQRQAGGARQCLQASQAGAVARTREQFRGDPRAAGKHVGEPAGCGNGIGKGVGFRLQGGRGWTANRAWQLGAAARDPQREATRRECGDVGAA